MRSGDSTTMTRCGSATRVDSAGSECSALATTSTPTGGNSDPMQSRSPPTNSLARAADRPAASRPCCSTRPRSPAWETSTPTKPSSRLASALRGVPERSRPIRSATWPPRFVLFFALRCGPAAHPFVTSGTQTTNRATINPTTWSMAAADSPARDAAGLSAPRCWPNERRSGARSASTRRDGITAFPHRRYSAGITDLDQPRPW